MTSDSCSHASTVAKHYNQIEEVGLEERTRSRIFYLRNLNNWVKSMLINEFLEKTREKFGRNTALCVLDLCSGKGGDLLKWKKGNVSHVVCADIAGTSVEQSQIRYKEMVERTKMERFNQHIFTAEFITLDCTKGCLKESVKSQNTKFDLVSCQFSIHYCFESLPQAEIMLKNACEMLRPGGYFIGTTTNAYELVKRLRASDSMSFGNDVYRVTFQTDSKDNLPIFGSKFDFHLEGVVDCPEFLLYFPVLEQLAKKYNMKLVYKKTFGEFVHETIKQREGRNLIGKMQALEPYPADEDIALLGSESADYNVAKEYLGKRQEEMSKSGDNRRPSKIGTLSQSEWEASTIYLTFAFQKLDDDSSSTAPASSSSTAGDTASSKGKLLGKRKHDNDNDY